MYNDYNEDIDWQKNIWIIQTNWKDNKEISSELNDKLWN